MPTISSTRRDGEAAPYRRFSETAGSVNLDNIALLSGIKRTDLKDIDVPAQFRPEASSPVASLFHSSFPEVNEADYRKPLRDVSMDSFALLEFRLTAEQLIGQMIPDQEWLELDSPSAIIAYLDARLKTHDAATPEARVASAQRTFILNMPHMALSGLSESWLWKQLGDVHWEMICSGLDTPSHALVDGNGDRLYATFTRLRVEMSAPLTAFAENDRLDLSGGIARLGAGLFFSDVVATSGGKAVKASIMSSFARRGMLTSNATLLKGQPAIPPSCQITELGHMPEFGRGYRDRRSTALPAAQFECEYEIIPGHDINGVGLLYFAAYPSITDICELKYIGRGNQWALEASVTGRDIYYFANCDIDDRIFYRVHSRRQQDNVVEFQTSLTRKSDNTLMAYVITRKELKSG